jgi:uncharacterized membrane protein YccF (DUF307 family)
MSPLSIALNLLWIVLGGLAMAIAWVIAGLILAVTIIGLPWTRAAFVLAAYHLAPFGRTIIRRDRIDGAPTLGTGPFGFIGNVIWLVLAGWWLALAHLAIAVPYAISIIGLPFAWAHLKLAGAALCPIGMTIVPTDDPLPQPYRQGRR